ncbi:hypothetical protein KUTeg_024576 [Tegillarca granosa]|uniref:Guanylate cyclase domain-containing protein n=1 Tax=Tegillarca granosa TaxID=220873 RepID=A0ABQ9E3H0_TEGGR|nr:hypothetical protein KUTeg_024576 [Tegillarca granosa]
MTNYNRRIENWKTKNKKLIVLPETVANDLRHGRSVSPSKHENVTILFSGIVGFGDFCAKHSDSKGATEIVETVGDKYMAVSGLPEPCSEHTRCIARLALDMMEISKQLKDPDGKEIIITIGIHSGEVVTGVIGKRMPRYCLFGNTVNLTSRTETTGEKGRINTPECFDPEFKLEYRGEVKMKGKPEPMKCYFLSRNPIPFADGEPEETETSTVCLLIFFMELKIRVFIVLI